MSASQPAPTRLRYQAVRLVLRAVLGAYVRTRVVDAGRLPTDGSYIICFNHPSWLDPLFFAAYWPDTERDIYIFGPREQDMSVGARNALITWTRRGVPFKPRAQDVIDTTRRTMAVLDREACLAIAGEGRLSDHEGEVRPLETGLAHFARLAGVPIVPVAVVGTRWVSFGSRVTLRVGDAVYPDAHGGGKPGARAMTDEVAVRLQALLHGVEDRDPPGWFGRTLSEAFNERPWLDDPEAEAPADAG